MNHRTFSILACLSIALGLAGCDVTGMIYSEDGGEPLGSSEQFVIESIRLEGTTLEDCTVEVREQSDGDQTADQVWWTQFQLDDGDGPQSLPKDTGGQQINVLNVTANPSAGGDPIHKRVTITLYE